MTDTVGKIELSHDPYYQMLCELASNLGDLGRRIAVIEGKLAKMGESFADKYSEKLELG